MPSGFAGGDHTTTGREINMNLGSLLPNAAIGLDRFNHQGQIKAFEEKLSPQGDADKSFLSNLFKVSQGAVSSMVGGAVRNPASTLVYGLLASSFSGAIAKALSPNTMPIARAIDDCLEEHRHDGFSITLSEVRCAVDVVNDLCSDRELGSSSRYNVGLYQPEPSDSERNKCLTLVDRILGWNAVIPSASKTSDDIIKDVINDVVGHPEYKDNIDYFDAQDIIEAYGLIGMVDDRLMDKRDVADWIYQHKLELERKDDTGKRLAHPPALVDFIHAADNRYKESFEIKDYDTYKAVLRAIHDLNLQHYVNSYYGHLIESIAKRLHL